MNANGRRGGYCGDRACGGQGRGRAALNRWEAAARAGLGFAVPLLLAGALAGGAGAARADVLVSNTHETESGSSTDWTVAQSFETGGNTGGYTVSNVEIHIRAGSDTVVRIRLDDDGAPGLLVTTLSNPASFKDLALNTFAAPAGTALRASETYWLTVNEGSRMFFEETLGDSETGAPGWSIADGTLTRRDSDASWSTDISALIIAVNGTADAVNPANAKLKVLAVQGGTRELDLSPGFAPAQTSYSALVPYGVSRVTVVAVAQDPDASLAYLDGEGNAIADADEDADGHQVDLEEGENVVQLQVQAANGMATLAYGLTVTRQAADATLSALALRDGTRELDLSPGFHPIQTTYSATVASAVAQVTVVPTRSSPDASVAYVDGEGNAVDDADGVADGHQVDLEVGANVVYVQVTAADHATVLTYTVTVHRVAAPTVDVPVGIAANPDRVGAGVEDLVFTLRREGATTDPLQVTVSIEQDEDWLGSSDLAQVANFDPGEADTRLTLAAGLFSFEPEAGGELTATVGGTGIQGGSKEVTVVSTSEPPITISLDVSEYTFAENYEGQFEPSTFHVEAKLHADYPRRAPSRVFTVSFKSISGTARTPSDYVPISEFFQFTKGDFADDGTAMVAGKSFATTIKWDLVAEGDETFTVEMQPAPGLPEGMALFTRPDGTTCEGWSCTPRPSYTVTITDTEGGIPLLLEAEPEAISEADDTGTPDIAENVSEVEFSGPYDAFEDDYTVTLVFEGTAVQGTDYTVSPADVDSAAEGHQATVDEGADELAAYVTVTAVDNDLVDGSRTIEVSGWLDGEEFDAVTITIEDDERANAAPVFADPSEDRTVAEHAAPGAAVGAPVQAATDADGDTLTYSLEGADAASFAFDAATRQIATRDELDFETRTGYSVTVKADDGNGGTDTIAVAITVTDVDERVVLSKGSLNPDEGGSEGYTVKLSTRPTGQVTVDITGQGSTDLTPVPASLTFGTGDWNTEKPVTVSAAEDGDAEDDEERLTHTATGGGYASVTADLRVTVDDDETASSDVTLEADPATLAESAGTTTVNVTATLDGATRATPTVVTVQVGSGTATAGIDFAAVADFDVTIPADTASGRGGFDLTPVQDRIDEDDETVDVGGTATGLSVTATTVTLTDDDTRGVDVSKEELDVEEGETGTYTVVLESRPTAPVTVTPSSPDVGAATVSAALLFPVADWDEPQTVTVTAVEDGDAEDETVVVSHTVSGGDYAGTPAADVTVRVDDDDGPDLVLSKTSLNPPEGGSESYKVKLATLPTGNVTVDITGYAGTDLTLDKTRLMFATGTWNTDQTVTVSAAHDDDAVRDQATLEHRASGGGYGSVTKDLPVRVVDDETPPLTLTVEAVEAEVTEGEPVRYRIHMSRRTPGAVVRQRYRYQGDFVRNGPSSVVTGVNTNGRDELYWEEELDTLDDAADEADGSVKVTLEKPGAGQYESGEEYTIGTPDSATVTILDNDPEDSPEEPIASVEDVRVTEGPDAELAFPVRLNIAAPAAAEIGWYTLDGTAKAGLDYVEARGTLGFEAGDTVKTIDVEVLDDDIDEGRETMLLVLTEADGAVLDQDVGAGRIDDDDAANANARVDGPLMTLRYAEAPDPGSVPDPKDWVVRAATAAGSRTLAVTAVSVSGVEVALGLWPPALAGELVSVSYLPWAMHPLLLGPERVEAGPLTELAVRNETPPASAGTPGGSPQDVDGPPRFAEGLLRAGLPDGGSSGAERDPVLRLLAVPMESSPRRLDRRGLGLTDVRALAGLGGLEALDLSDNRIEDVWPLAGLAGLRRLDLSHNRVADVSALAELAGLEVLDLGGNAVEDAWPLGGLSGLRRLNVSDNRIADISALAELAGLEVLDLGGNAVEDIWPLAGLAGLRRLDLSGNRIVDVSALAGLVNLEVLVLDGNRVADVLPLVLLPRLARLDLAGNRVPDPVSPAGTLARLDLADNRIGDAGPLGDLSALVWLDMTGNPLSDVAPLSRLTALRWLWLDAGAPGLGTLAPHAEETRHARDRFRAPDGLEPRTSR